MIFKLLRQYLHDSEYELTRIELAEARKVLAEYKEFFHHQTQLVDDDRDKPDIEFIVLLWASIGLALTVAGNAVEKFPSNVMSISTIQEVVWLVIALVMIAFVILNLLFAIDLTRKYASFKSDKRYLMYYRTLSVGIIVVLIGLSLTAIFGGLP